MTHLPVNPALPVQHLKACFNNTVATYKFYWFLSIIQEVELGREEIPKRRLFSRMIANAWYTTNYFHVSFGKLDLIQEAVFKVATTESITMDADREAVAEQLTRSGNRDTIRTLQHFNKNVPHWFLSPWFPGADQAAIYQRSNEDESLPLYRLGKDFITIHPAWISYLKQHAGILKDFCLWNLSLFLQTRNPNVPDIPGKLVKSASRNTLTRQRQFWNLVLNDTGPVPCIYTGRELRVGNYDVEHFIPYQFIAHDLIWNLIPADPGFNSVKSDKLPPLDRYFGAFYRLQQRAIRSMKENHPRNPLLDDYLTIFPNLDEASLSEPKFRERIEPLILIASNNGFEFLTR